MTNAIPEAVWKHLSRLKPLALDRFCRQVLADARTLIDDDRHDGHERYLALYDLIQKRDRELGDAFNDLRRSTAIVRLAIMRRVGLIADDEYAGFTAATRDAVARFMDRT